MNVNVQIIDKTPQQSSTKFLPPETRQKLAIDVLSKNTNVSQLSREHSVSRKFLYQNAQKADDAIEKCFKNHPESDEKVLFYLPITKAFIQQFVIALLFYCHAPFRGVQSLLSNVFDYSLSLGSIHNIVNSVIPKARELNEQPDLSNISTCAHDEIFQAGRPVLAGVDAQSTYCYLLAQVDNRDETTWGVHLLELKDKGLEPDKVLADFGRGLRAGHKAAWPEIPCWGDIFHPLMDFSKLTRFLKSRLEKAENKLLALEIKRDKKRVDSRKFSRKLGEARKKEKIARDTYEVVSILANWVQYDILGLHGPSFKDREQLYDFVVDSLKEVECHNEYRIRPVRRVLENNKQELLYFAQELEGKLTQIANKWGIEVSDVYELSRTLSYKEERTQRWIRRVRHYNEFGETYEDIIEEVEQALSSTIRASSLVENFNSRLRSYFFLRRTLGANYLCLLQFYLNHHRYVRSRRKKRVGKSPRELLTGKEHAHWLELLGFERFKRP